MERTGIELINYYLKLNEIMKFIYRYIFFIALLMTLQSKAQIGSKLGSSPTTLNSGAILDLESTNRGVLLPRVAFPASTASTTFHLNGGAKPSSNGMIVYNTTANALNGVGYYVWSGTTGTEGTPINTSSSWSRIITAGATAPTSGQVLSWSGTSWAPITISATNGLSYSSGTTKLGGSLTEATTIAQAANTLAFTGSAVNSFSVDGATFSVDATNNQIGIGTTTPSHKLHVAGGSILFDVNDVNRNVHVRGQGTLSSYTTEPSAALDVSSLNKGFLPPRMTYQQILAISNPADGLIVYCIDCNPKSPVFYNDTEWSSYDGKKAPTNTALPAITLQATNTLTNTDNLIFNVSDFGSWDGAGLTTPDPIPTDFTYTWYKVRGTTTTMLTSSNLLNGQDPNSNLITVLGSATNLHVSGDKYYCVLKTANTFIPVSVKTNEITLDFSNQIPALTVSTTSLVIQGAGNFFEVTNDYTSANYTGANSNLTKSWEYLSGTDWVPISSTSVPGYSINVKTVNIPPMASGSVSLIGKSIRYKVKADNVYGELISYSNILTYSNLLNSNSVTSSSNLLAGTATVPQNIYVALSVRKINANYAGSAIRIANSTGSVTADIGFTASGDLDENAISTFMTTNNTSAYVIIWYDQSGNGRNAYVETIAAAPVIATRSGSTNTIKRYNTITNRPTISLDGDNDIMYVKAAGAAALTTETVSPRLNFSTIVPANNNIIPYPGVQLLFTTKINGNFSTQGRNGGVISMAPSGNLSSVDHFGNVTTANAWLPVFFTTSRVSLPNVTPQENYVGSYTLTSRNGVLGNITARMGGSVFGNGSSTISYSPSAGPHDGIIRIGSESSNIHTSNDYCEVIIRSLSNGNTWSSSNNLTNALEVSMGLYFGVTVLNN